jgi:hypothetical protein
MRLISRPWLLATPRQEIINFKRILFMVNSIDTALPTIRITTHIEYFDCETCGGYDSGHLHVELPDGRVLDADHDGHFGNGAWNGDPWVAHYWCLQALGVELSINGATLQDQGYREHVGEDWQDVTLNPNEPEIVEFTLITAPDLEEPEYRIPMSASWVKRNGEREYLVARPEADNTGTSWDGENTSLYVRVLQDRALLIEQQV